MALGARPLFKEAISVDALVIGLYYFDSCLVKLKKITLINLKTFWPNLLYDPIFGIKLGKYLDTFNHRVKKNNR